MLPKIPCSGAPIVYWLPLTFFDISMSFCLYIYVVLCVQGVSLKTCNWRVQSVISKLLLQIYFNICWLCICSAPISRVHIKQICTESAKNISPFLTTVSSNKLCAIMSILVTEYRHTQFPNHWAGIILLTTITNVRRICFYLGGINCKCSV
jgi:hypothetical protein